MVHSGGVRVYRYRWVVLLSFMLINMTIQVLWICFAPVTVSAAAHYHTSELRIGLLAMIFMIVYIPLALPASWAIDTFGFRKAVGFGAVLLGVFGLLRGLYTISFEVTLILTVGIGVAQPFLLNAYTKVAVQWFALEERATAIGLATVSSFLGIVIGEVLTPYLVNHHGLGGMQLIYGLATAASALIFLILARENPPTPASPPGHEERALVLDGLKHILHQRDFYYVAAAFLFAGGVFNGITTWVESIVRPKGMSTTQAGILGGLMLIGAIAGAIILPAISDHYHRRKPVLLLGMMMAVPALAALTFANSYRVLLPSFFALGLFMIGIAPVMYQYGAEITYPAPEGTSNGLFVLAMQVSVIFIYGMGWLDGVLGSFTPSLVVFIGLLVATCVLFALLEESPMMANKPEPVVEPSA